jgi:uroporphyrin-III C-methyltransferase
VGVKTVTWQNQPASDPPGTVYLIGAGPGDAELITVRGLRVLQRADVVVHDRLVAPELLDEAQPEAEVIDVGKHPGFKRYTQQEINALLVDRARAGLDVVRLKGGDPFILGRGGEEAVHCARAGVPFVVVPGVSSAHAVPAAAGIPITHRGLARTYAVVTGQTDPQLGQADLPYESLAAIDTLIILMGRSNLEQIATNLIAAGRSGDSPAACIEMGWTPQQRTVTATLATIAAEADKAGLRAPAVTVVGEVAALGSELTACLANAAAVQAAVDR